MLIMFWLRRFLILFEWMLSGFCVCFMVSEGVYLQCWQWLGIFVGGGDLLFELVQVCQDSVFFVVMFNGYVDCDYIVFDYQDMLIG